ncbi:MAG: CRISPR-associated protein Cas4 [Chloroflexota bacterium]|nr:CRISPR-associated protein Cas4 [Chloroflexota bacterium]
MWKSLLVVSLLCVGLALWLAIRASRGRRRSGLPKGRLVYADTGKWSVVSRPYFSRQYQLTGKPDYLVETRTGLVPVEVKRTSAPGNGTAYDSHIMQLAAYCLLIEQEHEETPPFGLIHYNNATIQIDFTTALRRQLIDLMKEMRKEGSRRNVPRNHEQVARCRACGVRHACGDEAG